MILKTVFVISKLSAILLFIVFSSILLGMGIKSGELGISSLPTLTVEPAEVLEANGKMTQGISSLPTLTVEPTPTKLDYESTESQPYQKVIYQANDKPTSLWNSVLNDLLLNLTSEAIGIAVTVFIINKIIKRQEEKRWKPVRSHVLANLLEIVDRLLFWLVPTRFRLAEAKTIGFGYADAKTIFALTSKEYDLIEETIKNDVEIHSSSTILKLKEVRRQVDHVRRSSLLVSDAVFSGYLIKLDRLLGDLEIVSFSLDEGIAEGEITDYAKTVRDLIELSVELSEWLVKQAV